MKDIYAILTVRQLGASFSVISKSLSVVKEGDRERLLSIIQEFPAEFVEIDETEFENWFAERYEKTKRYKRFWKGSCEDTDKRRIAEAEAVVQELKKRAVKPVRK